MKKAIQIILMGIGILALAGILVITGMFFGRANIYHNWASPFNMMSNFANQSGSNNNAYGPGMMGAGRGYASGMMGSRGGMMSGYGYNTANLTPLTTEQAYQAAETYLGTLDNPDLQIDEVMVFDNNAYIVVKEINTGLGAFELLVDSGSQVAYPEYGPNMMWNLKYSGLNHQYMMGGRGGLMGGMMGSNTWSSTTPADVSADLTVAPEKAIEYAQVYLDANIAGATAADDPIQFYGYYTLDFEKDGAVVGMLSVNGFNGQVFLHTWHGTFIEEKMY
ncbi:MAG: hypothetical protein A2X25_09650 [Chloroflexi bacterium GWB2_49_20]|nr:MAG: hypothetical protein A2X25_09650 [Chloroflexi bacterium GWB2_49_20]OGN79313.1 MAG: hypothetical protein A2X26_04375 [Chloroflexi bacterium GWC2_49_37]OGN82917.1 MAG: hypothetical protein A2X27_08320 [Chloroflexi bacterium GWD2_49_16]HCC78571.1 hypothetical protein [Anaerolineae bacterium]